MWFGLVWSGVSGYGYRERDWEYILKVKLIGIIDCLGGGCKDWEKERR